MLVFIIPIKSSKISNSWELTCKLFERTIKSVFNQTSSGFRVIVVCHEQPNIEFKHPNITYIEVNFPVPTWEIETDHSSRERDKERKLFTGLVAARQLKPSHIMFVDSDDCVSRHLAEFVSQNYQHNGWFIGRGYEYRDGSKFILHRRKDFHRKCGTSHLVKWELIDPPESVKIEDVNWGFFYHQDLVQKMAEKGTSLELLPFEGAVYIIENGDNYTNQKKLFVERFKSNFKNLFLFYARRAYKSFTSQLLTKSIREEFGLYDIH